MSETLLCYSEPISLLFLQQTVSHMRRSTCSIDSVPTKFLKGIFETDSTTVPASAVPVQNVPVRNGPIAWPAVLLLAAF